jgi:hypothetical protein
MTATQTANPTRGRCPTCTQPLVCTPHGHHCPDCGFHDDAVCEREFPGDPALRIAARPFTSPCATCHQPIPEELNTLVFALAADHVATVCDTCAQRIDPAAFTALADLRRLDTAYWAIVGRSGRWPQRDRGAEADANAYLRTLTDGLAAISAMYLPDPDPTDGAAP